MKELLEMIAKALVNHPEEVEVRSVEGQHLIVLELCVHPEDVGQVIGRYGRTHVCQPPRNDRSGHSHRARASRPQTIGMTVRYSHLAPKHTLAAVERLDAPIESPTDTTTDTRVFEQPAAQVAVLH